MPDTLKIDVLNGPNTNLYGLDPGGPYGRLTLSDIEGLCRDRARQYGASVRFRQSSSEGTLIDWIHDARSEADGLVINGGSLSYTSIGVMDALASFEGPSFQVHVSKRLQTGSDTPPFVHLPCCHRVPDRAGGRGIRVRGRSDHPTF